MAVLNDGEIFAKVHKFKLFRKEGNLLIDVYEALIGKPAHKFIAVPNMVFEESDKKYFGFGDTKGDALKDCLSKIKEISAASIIAKVWRDNYMINASEAYPQYKWSKNKGYPTREHIRAIKEHGLSPLHRHRWCEKWI